MIEYIDSEGVVLTKQQYRAGMAVGRVRQVVTGFEPSVTDESKLDECDLNVLVQRWLRGEPVPQFEPAQFGDVSTVGDFQEMQERLLKVESMFAQLPAHLRERFRNSAVEFADAMVDESRRDELTQLGLFGEPQAPPVEPPPAPVPVPAPVEPPPIAKPS